MPKGVYIRTEKIRKGISAGRLQSPKAQQAARNNIKKGQEVAHKLPRTQKQIGACRQNMIRLNKEGKRGHNGFDKKPLMGDDIVEHHNDLQHGAIRPDDIIYMTNREHTSLHAKLQNQPRDSKGRFI